MRLGKKNGARNCLASFNGLGGPDGRFSSLRHVGFVWGKMSKNQGDCTICAVVGGQMHQCDSVEGPEAKTLKNPSARSNKSSHLHQVWYWI